MKSRIWNSLIYATVLTFCLALVLTPLALAFSPQNPDLVDVGITIKVNQKGFSDTRGKLFDQKNTLKIPKGQVVRITFVFDESMTSLAYGDTHQVAITGNEGWTKEAEKIWMLSRQSSITFQAGNVGETYRAYCIIDCIGMEHLNNLIIQVV
ncbi:MAG: hypothetical protein KC563_05545 [Nitrospira sp.]|nr:hypothetical protein [Nitrospira sp.]MCB9712119.1 hypothetical protein [Nitrospiraceae bacterium]MDR4488330.1 hypothetical protein [Nitrospirales bacterium]MCA9464334.1 hypothetical protein [Nitrospira sp.]MCA9475255.1 hypothetical protein [Nitrospira sp.]